MTIHGNNDKCRAFERSCPHCASARPSGTEAAGPPSKTQQCAVAQAAYEFGLHLIPELAPNRDLFDALELGECGLTPPPSPTPTVPRFPLPQAGIFVDPVNGDDSNAGTEKEPLATVKAAVTVAGSRAVDARTVVLRAGVHTLAATVEVGPSLSGLTLQNFPGESAWLSGGQRVTPEWRKAQGFPEELNVWEAALPEVPRALGLNRLEGFVDPTHARMTRARFPNRVSRVM